MRALIYHKSVPIVDRLIKELVTANKNILFSETENYEEALDLFIAYKPEIIILDIEKQDGFETYFLQKIRYYLSNIKEINISNHPFTKIILISFSNAELQTRHMFGE